MIPVHAFKDRTVAVLGLARSGLSASRALAAGGADVVAWDDAEGARDRARALDLRVAAPDAWPWARLAALVLSPGIPLTHPAPHPLVARAGAAGIEVIGDIELFARAGLPARVAGVTGTNGKSTTTALLGHLLAAAGVPTQVGGNLGVPALDLAPLGSEGVYVIEMSSYGIDLTRSLDCAVAVLLNITPDHIERHGDFAGYVAAKHRLFAMQSPGRVAVVGVDDEEGRALEARLLAEGRRVIPVAVGRKVPGGVYVVDGAVIDATAGAPVPVADLTGSTTLWGAHNWQNAGAAVAAARSLGVPAAALAQGLATFPGLAHRLELVAEGKGLRFVNDSKATNADAAARALASFDTIYWIIGGRPKQGGLAGTEPWWDRVAHAFLIGEAATEFAGQLKGRVGFTPCGDLATAVDAAAHRAWADRRPGAVVLLSPACASFDQFRDFEERGAAFRALVKDVLARCGGGVRERVA